MRKYTPLWEWIRANGTAHFSLSFTEIKGILGFPIDHSFLTDQKELLPYGFRVSKISMKEQTVSFEKRDF